MANELSEKTPLRNHFKTIRQSISLVSQKKIAEDAAKTFLQNINIGNHDIISVYYPINNEISPLPLIEEINATICLPVITDKNKPLIFRQWNSESELVFSDRFKILEPTSNSLEVTPSIIITPLLAFDSSGTRLGYGGGFYDRTISNLKKTGHKFITVGLAYSKQHAKKLPKDSFDQKLDYVVTENEFFNFN